MSNLSDKDLDRLSREAADLYEPDDSSLSWNRLEQKLIREMPDRPPDGFRFGRMSPYVWGPAVVLLTGLSFFLIKNSSDSKHSTRNNQIVNQSVSTSAKNDKKAEGITIHVDSNSSTKGQNKRNNIIADGTHQTLASDDEKSKNNKPDALHTDRIDNESRYAESASSLHSNRISRSTAGTAMSAAYVGASESAAKILNGRLSNANEISDESTDAAVAMRNKTSIELPALITGENRMGKVSGNDSLMNLLAQSKTPIHQKTLHLNRSLNFGFTFGPDYTNAGGIPNNQIGNNIGLTVGYYLTSKLSINTGIIYSNKFYWSKAHNNYFFQPPANITPMAYARTFVAAPPIDNINGASNIWELPLTLRYDFVQYNKTRFFANAGFSSYFMMKQTYIYFLHSGQNQRAYQIVDNQQENYWFGVANLSVGFEAEVGKGFSFQAEPFLKLPLQNMGMENLKLTSYGFLLTFKYAPVLSRSKK